MGIGVEIRRHRCEAPAFPPEIPMSRKFLFFCAAILLQPLALSRSQETGAKTLSEPVTFLDRAGYDAEAALRIQNFKLPEDVTAALFADSSQIQNPSAICFDSKGRLYVAEIHRWRAGVQDIRNEPSLLLDDLDNQSSADRLEMYQRDQLRRPLSFYTEFTDQIVRLEDSDYDGRADGRGVWATGFNDVLDGPGIGLIAGADDSIYYTNIPHLWKLSDSDGDGKAEERISLQDGFGVRMSISGHDMHGLAWGPDGKLYWSIGDRGYSFTTKEGRRIHRPYTGGVLRCDPDGSNLEEFYSGLRNPQELAFDAWGNLFTCDNNADAWDTGRLVYLIEGGDSGWHHGHQVMLNFRNPLKLRTPVYQHPGHKEVPLNAWLSEALWEPDHPGRPAHALPPIDKVSWGPSGLVYNHGVTTMPERYAGHFWVCNFGGSNGDLEAFSVSEAGAGFKVAHREVFMEGLGNTDVEFGPDGRMYLSCFNNSGWYKQDLGNIYTLTSPDREKTLSDSLARLREILTKPFSGHDDAELGELLAHPDLRVRQEAQFELARRSNHAVFEAAITSGDRFARIHGIRGIGQLLRADASRLGVLTPLLADADAEIRAQTARVLSDSRLPAGGEALVALLDDSSARVKSFAAIGVGKCGITTALPKLLEILAVNDNQDVFLRHACVEALWYLNEREKILKEVKNESAAVRLGVLLTLRKLLDPRVKYFLTDSDESIRNEAIRAIHDLNLPTAQDELAETIRLWSSAAGGGSAPVDHRDWILHTRLINANFRLGGTEQARHLLGYAANTTLPALLREQALLALLEWKEPGPVDAVTGQFLRLDPSARADLAPVVKELLPTIFKDAKGTVLGLATRLALAYDARVPEELLKSQLMDDSVGTVARVDALDGLFRQNRESLSALWPDLTTTPDAGLRAAAARRLHEIDPARGIAAAIAMADSKEIPHRQFAYRLLGGFEDPAATALLRDRLRNWDQEIPGAQLDLLESAAQKADEEIKKLLAAREADLDPADPLAAFRVALEGGDVDKGREIFLTHAAAQCSKCHKLDGDGGIAGPELTEIGKSQPREYLLQALIAPSDAIAPGYGVSLITLKDGTSLGGFLLGEDEKNVVLKVPDPDRPDQMVERTIPVEEIATRQPPISAMPPMGALLNRSEIRDLVAFLGSLKGKDAKKGH